MFNLFTAGSPQSKCTVSIPISSAFSPCALCHCAGSFLVGMRLPSRLIEWDLTLSGTILWFIVFRLTSDSTTHLLDAKSFFLT